MNIDHFKDNKTIYHHHIYNTIDHIYNPSRITSIFTVEKKNVREMKNDFVIVNTPPK